LLAQLNRFYRLSRIAKAIAKLIAGSANPNQNQFLVQLNRVYRLSRFAKAIETDCWFGKSESESVFSAAAAAMQSGYAGVSVPFGISDSNPAVLITAVPITAVQMRVLQSFDTQNPPLISLTLDQDQFPGMVRWVILSV